MNKPLMAFAGMLAVGATAVGVYVALPGGGEEEVVEQVATGTPSATATVASSAATTAAEPPDATPTKPPDGVVFRWMNVTLVVTPDSGVAPLPTRVGPDVKPPNGGLAFELIRHVDGENTSNVFVDAENGQVLVENVRPEDRAAIDAVLKTLAVTPLDRASAPWPYNGEPSPGLVTNQSGNFVYIEPTPATGVYVYMGTSTPGGPFISIENERSSAFVRADATTGALIIDTSAVHEEDALVFDRWLATVKQCGSETEC